MENVNDKAAIVIPKTQIYTLVFSFILAFVGSWVQLNARMSKMETQIDHLQKVVLDVTDMNTNIAILIEQNKYIEQQLKEQREAIKCINKDK